MTDSSYSTDLPYRQPPPPAPLPRVRPFDAIAFPFRQEGVWASAGLAVVFLFIPVVGQIAFRGYQAEIFQRLVRRDPTPMPRLTFDDFTRYMNRGLAGFLTELVLYFGVFMGLGLVAGALVLAIVFASNRLHHDPTAAMLSLWGFVALASIVLQPLFQAATTRAAMTEDVSLALQPRAVLRYTRATFGATLVALVLFAPLAACVLLGGMLLCAIGAYPAIVLVQLGMVHLRWQIYEAHVARGGEPIPMKLEPARPPQVIARPYYAFQESDPAVHFPTPRDPGAPPNAP